MTRRVLCTVVLAGMLGVGPRLGAVRAAAAPSTCSRGDSGALVREVQGALRSLGYLAGPADGAFGPVTEKAVRAFQAKAGLVVDGVVGPRTLSALRSELSKLQKRQEQQKRIEQKRASLEQLRKQVLEARKTGATTLAALAAGSPAGSELPASRGVVYLTFDDGPDPSVTPWILDCLAARRIRATFFVVGRKAEENQAIVSRMASEGHSVQNHSYAHTRQEISTQQSAEAGIALCAEVIERLTGARSRYYRPPEGVTDAVVLEAAANQSHTVALWSNLWGDDASSAAMSAFDGAVLMIRERAAVKESLPQLLDRLESSGYRFSVLGG